MLSKKIFTQEYISELRGRTGDDPLMIERTLFAFGLLEAIKSVDMPFVFKGGTSLMLLLDIPRRFSTDIDIVVEPGTDIDSYIEKAKKVFPFYDKDEDVRKGKNNIEKRHFRFKYLSPSSGKEVVVILDVLFEERQYPNTVFKPIRNSLLLTEGEDLIVEMPDVESILGDKLTAFAPRTTGIEFGQDKELEIIKQLFDCATLFDIMKDIEIVRDSYNKVVRSEMSYRGLTCSVEDVLKDTIRGCLCIATRGGSNPDDFKYYIDGIGRIRNHIISQMFNGEIAGAYASRVMYLAASVLTGNDSILGIKDGGEYVAQKPEIFKPKWFSYMRIVDPVSYGYLIEASRLLKNVEI
ncbi:MAG: nucleotidyl transferase AbiEii/AbiGii toxin family protein [Lachnospiraceae bacterium]|nr:nucleotidyl transferase AbiEii/AbiGii toxin family protein [Lachnospiraceae bacterium]